MRTQKFKFVYISLWWLLGGAAISFAAPAFAQQDHDARVEQLLASISDLKPFLSDFEYADYEQSLNAMPEAEQLERLLALAHDYVLQYEFERYQQTVPRLTELAERSKTIEIKHSLEIFQVLIDLEASGDYDHASHQLRIIADRSAINPDQKLMALISLAYTQSDAQEIARSTETLRELIALSRKMSLSLTQRIDVASVSEFVLSGAGDHEGALSALSTLPDLYTELGLPVDKIWALSKLTEYFLSTGEYEKAIAPSQQAIAIAIAKNDPLELLYQYHYCGVIFTELKRYSQAADCFLKAQPHIHLIAEREVWSLQMTTNALIQSERLTEARIYFSRLEDKIASNGTSDALNAWTQEIRAQLLHAEGAYEQAFALLVEYADAQEERLSEQNEETAKQLRLLMTEEADYLRRNESLNQQIIVRQRWIVTVITCAALIVLVGAFLLWRNRRALMRSAKHNHELLSQTQDLAAQLSSEVKRNDHLARHDELTGLLNRRGFFERLPIVIEEADEQKKSVAFGVLDLDRFKRVNDIYGHAVGDRLLQEVGARLTNLLGEGATIGRLGGDEFAVILPVGTHEKQARKFGQAITASLSQKAYLDGIMLRPRASIGFAIYPNIAKDSSELYANADLALYAAKEKRRGSVSFFDAELKKKSTRSALIEQALHTADETQFFMEYQPIFDANGEMPLAVEALARWQHPSFGDISPSEFIPLAERNGAMARLSKVFLKRALEDARGWTNDVRLSVNLSAIDLSSLEHARDLRDIILKSEIDPAQITLEVVEKAIVKDRNLTIGAMSIFKEIGVQIALDDFGSGQASLAHLRHLPIDQLKIDRTLTEEIERDFATRRIVKTVIEMCTHLDLDCVVVGVSNENKFRIVRKEKTTLMQGFHFAKPMSFNKIDEFLRQAREDRSLSDLSDPLSVNRSRRMGTQN